MCYENVATAIHLNWKVQVLDINHSAYALIFRSPQTTRTVFRSSEHDKIRCRTSCWRYRRLILKASGNLEGRSASMTFWIKLSGSFGGCKMVIILAPFARKRFWLRTQTFLYRYVSFTRKWWKRMKMFSLQKRYPKWKLLKMQQMKHNVSAENVNAKNANAENLFYLVWSTTKVGVDSEKPWQERISCSWCCC